MVFQLFLGGILIGLTVVFHAIALDLIIRNTNWLQTTPIRKLEVLRKAITLAIVVLAVTCALIVEIWVWALFYLGFDALPDLETALYFSGASFTTLGFGDVILDKEWRLLSSIEATNGFLLFGWSTAFIFEIVTRLYRSEAKEIKG